MKSSFLIFLIITQLFTCNFISKKNNTFNEEKYVSLNLISIRNELLKKKFKDSIKKLESLEFLYFYPPYIQKIYIYLIYAYYKTSNFEKAQYTIEKFFHIHPTHRDTDFVLYINGLIHLTSKQQKFLKKILCKDTIENDLQKIYMALASFTEIINYYPNSKFQKSSKNYVSLLKEKLAKQELRIIRYYMKKGAYIAVMNRSKKAYEEFPENEKILSEISSYMKKIKNLLNIQRKH